MPLGQNLKYPLGSAMKNFASVMGTGQGKAWHVNWKKSIFKHTDIFVNEGLWLLYCFCNTVEVFENTHTHTHTHKCRFQF